MSWQDIEEAVQQAVVTASGFPPSSVIWSYQNQGEFPLPYIRLNFGGARILGIDRVQQTYNATRPNGQEFASQVKGVREVGLDIEVFTAETTQDAAARYVLEQLRSFLRLDNIRIPLIRAGLSPFDPGPVLWIPDIAKEKFRGRAICTIRCYVGVMDVIEYVGYIARVNGLIGVSGYTGALIPSGMTGIPFSATIST